MVAAFLIAMCIAFVRRSLCFDYFINQKGFRMEREKLRLNKYLSEIGFCSRREADALVDAKRVTIDGRIAVMGDKVTGDENICVDRKPVGKTKDEHTYILLNKPRGIVCTTKNDKDNVIDYLKLSTRVFPVGRLDKDSEGLLLLSSDGDIVNRMMRAGNFHEKEYIVKVNNIITDDFIKRMSAGVYLEELEQTTRPCKVKKINDYELRIILTQGLNRQIRRMCQALGYRVIKLKRIRIMNLKLDDLKVGQWRNVTQEELKELKRLLASSANTSKFVKKDRSI